LNPHEDAETVQKIFAVLLGKNTRRGHAPDCAARLRPCLRVLTNTVCRIAVVAHNETTSDGTTKSVCVWISSRPNSGCRRREDSEDQQRNSPQRHAHEVQEQKSKKQDRQQRGISMINIQKLPSVHSGVPISGIAETGAELI